MPFGPEETEFSLKMTEPSSATLENDGFKLLLKGKFGDLTHGVHKFQAIEMHVHHPSEHTVNKI